MTLDLTKTIDEQANDAGLPHHAWFLVCDGEKALFLRNEGSAKTPDLAVQRVRHQENPPDRQLGTDRPGRFNDGPSVQRSAVEETDWHQLNKERFAEEAFERFVEVTDNRGVEQVIVVAPPTILGVLRDHYPADFRDKVLAELPKTLTNHPVDDMTTIIARDFQGLHA